MTYKVCCHELVWMNTIYEVEADSPEDIEDIILSGDANAIQSDFDTLDQCDIESVILIDK